MLKTFRKGADGFLAKLLLGFLVLTFALWGVGDIFRAPPSDTIATVNGEAVTMGELEMMIRNQQARFPELTAEVAQSLPVRLQMLNQIVNARLLQAEADAIGLNFSEDALSSRIAKDPMFQDEQGRFSKEQFLYLLRENNMSQSLFMQRYNSDLRNGLMQQALLGATKVPPHMVQLYYHILNEEREASLILIDADAVGKVADPGDETLQSIYDTDQENYRLPEYRTYRYVYFDAAMIAKLLKLEPSDEELQAYYDANKTDDRSFEDSKAEIKAYLIEEKLNERLGELSNQLDDTIASGATLEEALKAAKLSDLKIETLGPISATNQLKNGETYTMPPFEMEMLQTAFDQDAGQISPISLSSDNHYFLVETLEVIPSEVPGFETVKKKIKAEWLKAQKREALVQKGEALAAELQQAENPKAAIEERGVTLHETGKIKRHHDTVSNQSKLKDKILPSDLVQALFTLKTNEISAPFPLPSGEIAIGLLTKIHPAAEPKKADLEILEANLNQQLRMQMIQAYFSALREKHDVELFVDKIVAGASS